MIRPTSSKQLIPQSNTQIANPEGSGGDWLGYPAKANDAPESSSSVSLSLAMNSLTRCWRLASVVGLLLAAGVAYYFWSTFVPVYAATAWVQLDSAPVSIVGDQRQHESRYSLNTVVELMRSPAVLDEVVRHQGLADRRLSADGIARDLAIEQQNDSELFRVTYAHPNPETAAAVVNTVLDVYGEVQQTSTRARTQRVIELLEKDKVQRLTELEGLRVQQRLMLVKHPEFAPLIDATSSQPNTASMLQQRLVNNEVEYEVLQARLSSNQESLEAGQVSISDSMIDAAVDDDMRVRKLMEDLTVKEDHLSSARSISKQGEDAVVVRQLRHDVELFRQRLAELRKTIRPTVAARLREAARNQREQEIATAADQLKGLKAAQGRLKEQLAAHTQEGLSSADPAMAEFQMLAAEIGRSEAIFRQIAERCATLETELRAPTRVAKIRDAAVPRHPVVANPYLKMSLFGGGAFVLPFLVGILWDRRARRIVESRQIHQDVGLNLLGEIVRLPRDAYLPTGRGSDRTQRERRMHDESVDAITTRLLLSPELRDVQVLATASAVSGEGKTHLASHLAVSLARAYGEPTLLIDADLRSPSIYRAFQVSNDHGLADLLDGRITLDESIVKTWSKTLHILPAGQLTKSPHTLFRNAAFADVMQHLRARYRYIILDVPPVLAASESLIVAEAADATLLCAMRDFSRAPQVKLAYDHLLEAGAAPLGVVLGGVPTRNYESTYGAYYYQTKHTSHEQSAPARARRSMVVPQADQDHRA